MNNTGKERLLTEETLKTLSHLEPMTLEKIFLDFSQDFLMSHPDILVEDLGKVLEKLKRQKKVKETKVEGQKAWIKVFPKRGILARILKWRI